MVLHSSDQPPQRWFVGLLRQRQPPVPVTPETTLFADDPHMFFPGPVDVPDDAMAAQLKPLFGHRSDRMDELFGVVQKRLR